MVKNPLASRTCLTLMTAGITGLDGGRPLCMGKNCSSYENCMVDVLSNKQGLAKLRKGKTGKRIRKGAL